MVDFKRAGDFNEEDMNYGLLIYGDPGAGKTHAASLAPMPLVILTEPNGMATVRRANPDAIIAEVSNVKELTEVLLLALKGGLPKGVRTLVLDGLTEIQRLFKDDILDKKTKEQKKMGFLLQDWGTMAERMRKFMRVLRDVKYHVVATALCERDEDRFKPLFEGKKTGSEVAQYFNAVAYFYKTQETDVDGNETTTHHAMFDAPSRITAKPMHPLHGTMNTEIDQWFALLKGDKDNNEEK